MSRTRSREERTGNELSRTSEVSPDCSMSRDDSAEIRGANQGSSRREQNLESKRRQMRWHDSL